MRKSFLLRSLVLLNSISLCYTYCAAAAISDWHGVANKNHVIRIVHDDQNLYVSSSGGGITVINKATGKQATYNRATETSFDNYILDMKNYDGELWATGRFYGLGKLSAEGDIKFDMVKAGCMNTQWMQGLLIESPSDIMVGGLNAFYQFNGERCTYSYMYNPLSPMAMTTDIKKNSKGEIFVSCSDWGTGGSSLFKYSDGELTSIENPCYLINRMAVTRDALWLASDGQGLVKYEDGKFTQYTSSNSGLPFNSITDLTTDKEGTVWMACCTHISSYKDGEFISYALPDEWSDNDIFLSIDADGEDIYAGTQKHGLVKLTNGNINVVELINNPDFGNNTTGFYRSSSCMDKDGNFLMASTEGLNVYNAESGDSKIIPFDMLREVTVSPANGDIWVRLGGDNPCIKRLGKEPLTFYNQIVPVNNEVFNIMTFDADGNLWVAVANGLMSYDGNSWTSFTEKEAGFPISHIKCLAFDSRGRLWCGAFGEKRIGNGLIMFDGNRWSNYKTANSGLPSDFVGSIAIDKDDVVWLNCRNRDYPEVDMYGYGLTSFDGNHWTTYNTSNSNICSNHIYSIGIDSDNTKWLATTGDIGIMSFDGKDWELYCVDNSGIALNTVNDITIDDQRHKIWFVHVLGCGASYASLNTHQGGVREVTDNSSESIIGQPLSVYNLQGVQVYSTPNYDGNRLPLAPGVYIIVMPNESRKILIK